MMKKVLTVFALFMLMTSVVAAYGGGGGSSAVFLNDKINSEGNRLSHLTIKYKQNFKADDFSDKSILEEIIVNFPEKVKKSYIDVYEMNTDNAKKLYPMHNFEKLLKIDCDEEISNMTLRLKMPKIYNYRFLHEQDGGSWIDEPIKVIEYDDDNVILETNFNHLSYFAVVTTDYKDPNQTVTEVLDEVPLTEENQSPELINLTITVENETMIVDLQNVSETNVTVVDEPKDKSIFAQGLRYVIIGLMSLLGLFGLGKLIKRKPKKVDIFK